MPGIGGTSASEPVHRTARSKRSVARRRRASRARVGVERRDARAERGPSIRAVLVPARRAAAAGRSASGSPPSSVASRTRSYGQARLAADQRQRHVRVALAERLADRLAGDPAADDEDAAGPGTSDGRVREARHAVASRSDVRR